MNAKQPTRGQAAVPEGTSGIAEDLKASAHAAGATGARVTMAQRRLRDTAIIAAIHAGQKPKEVAESFELTVRQVRRIVTEHQAMPSVLDQRPLELVEEMISMYRRAVADFEAMADYYRDSHPNVALGAKRGALDTRERLQGLLEVIGKLPDNLELFKTEMEQRRFSELMLVKIKQVEDGEITLADLSAFFDLLKRPTTPLFDVEGEARELEPGEEAA